MTNTNEMSLPPADKLKDLIKQIWGKMALDRNKKGNIKTPFHAPSVATPSPQQLTLPLSGGKRARKTPLKPIKNPRQLTLPLQPRSKVDVNAPPKPKPTTPPENINTHDLSRPPFYQNSHKWFTDNFLGQIYRGPDLADYGFSIAFTKIRPGDKVRTGTPYFKTYMDDHMQKWNKALKRKLKSTPTN